VYPRSVQSGGPRGSQRHATGCGSAHAIWRRAGTVSAAQRHVCVLFYRPHAGGGPLIWSGHWAFEHKNEIKQQVIGLATDIGPYLPLPISNTRAGGGGGGGDRDKL